MNELKLMAMKAKSRLLNKGLRDIYSSAYSEKQKENKTEIIKPTINLASESERKKQLLNMLRNRVNNV